MSDTIERQLKDLSRMTTGELAQRYEDLHGHACRTRHRAYLIRKVAWRIAVFVDGCFWHGCPEHGTWPKSNAFFWRQKIERNRERDADTDEGLRRAGWQVIRVWEHEDPADAADRIEAALRRGFRRGDRLQRPTSRS